MFKKFLISLVLIGLFFSFSKADVQSVYFRFCDMLDQKDQNKMLNIQPGQETELCLNFFSTDPDPVTVKYGFSKGLLNENQFQICDQDMGDNNDFSKLFTAVESKREFTLKNGEVQTIKEKIKIPLGINGMIYGCMVYNVQKDDTRMGGVFDLIVRKSANLNLFVGGDSEIKSSVNLLPNKGSIFSSNKKIKAEFIDQELVLSFIVANDSNVSQNINMNGKIYNQLGFQQKFEVAEKKLIPSSQEEFKINVGILPFYKGPFTVKLDLVATPSFDFDTSNLDAKIKEPISINETGQIFIFTWVWIIILAFIILVIVLIFRAIFKKHHITTVVEQNRIE